MAHEVKDISPTGFYLTTSERWLIGTILMITLQRKTYDSAVSECTMVALSKVVRHGEDGVGFEFVPVDHASPRLEPTPGSDAADRRTIDHFLRLISRA